MNQNTQKRHYKKRLKKVEDFGTNLRLCIKDLNKAYEDKAGIEIDLANKKLFELLDRSNIDKEHIQYILFKNHTWQKNHLRILAYMAKGMQELGRLPTTTELASQSGLSEETIYKHLKEFKNNSFYQDEFEKFKFMRLRVLTALFNFGIQGDVKACKYYLEYTEPEPKQQAANFNQNNYIQLNSFSIRQEELNELPIQAKTEIEKIILSKSLKT